MDDRVPLDVRRAFGCRGEPELLAGGAGRTWRCGSTVLKAVDDESAAAWTAAVLDALDRTEEIVVPRPIASADGGWVVGGWTCTEYVPASHEQRRWSEIIAAGHAFHDQVRKVGRPSWMDRATDRWRRADLVAWTQRSPVAEEPYRSLLARLARLRRPIERPSQIVHGDLCGNVMFDRRDRPVIVDVSPYWRPADYATAIIAIDALEWEDAGPAALTWLDRADPSGQLLVRAAVFRIATSADAATTRGFDAATFAVHAATVAALEPHVHGLG